MFKRYIDVTSGQVWINGDIFAHCDCSELAKYDVVRIIEDTSDIWAEREPFVGKEYNVDFSVAYKLFEEAERKINANLRIEKYRSADYLESYRVLYAIYDLKYSERWSAWVNSSERTFLEKIYINHKNIWDKKSSIIKSAFAGMGLTDYDIDVVWNLGISYSHKPSFE